jgi:hypothetical protein
VRTLDLNKAAAFLHMHPQGVRTRAKRGLIPGAKSGHRWGSSTEPSFRASVGLSRSHTIFDATSCGSPVEPKNRQKLAGRLRMRARVGTLRQVIP